MNTQKIVLMGSLAILVSLSSCGGDGKKKPKVNNAPVATGAAVTTQADTELKGNLMASDADGDKLSYIATMQPTQGSLTLNSDGSYVYTPKEDTIGSDTFSFMVSDGMTTSASATVNITINKLDVAFDAYSRKAFAQMMTANPLPLETRNIQQNVTDPTAYDDLLK